MYSFGKPPLRNLACGQRAVLDTGFFAGGSENRTIVLLGVASSEAILECLDFSQIYTAM